MKAVNNSGCCVNSRSNSRKLWGLANPNGCMYCRKSGDVRGWSNRVVTRSGRANKVSVKVSTFSTCVKGTTSSKNLDK